MQPASPPGVPLAALLAQIELVLRDVGARPFQDLVRRLAPLDTPQTAPWVCACTILAGLQNPRPEHAQAVSMRMAQLERTLSCLPAPLLRAAMIASMQSRVEQAKPLAALAHEATSAMLRCELAHERGHQGEAQEQLATMLRHPEVAVRRSAAICVLQKSYYALNTPAVVALAEALAREPQDLSAQWFRAHGAWQLGLHEDALAHSRVVVQMVGPGVVQLRSQGMYQLTAGRYADALQSFTQVQAMLPPAQHGLVVEWKLLAERMHRGETTAVARLGDVAAKFRLSCCNNIALESDCHHVAGEFTEPQELAYCREFVPKGAHIVEVGTLVGNHTIYFALACSPASILAIDANPRCIEELRHNLALNDIEGRGVACQLVHAAAGQHAGSVDFPGIGTVPMVALDDVAPPRVDFLKIDVDGGEVGVIRGMQRLVRTHCPRIMIECDQTNQAFLDAWIREASYTPVRIIDHGTYKNWFLNPT